MSMHLASHGLTTTSTRKRKSKVIVNGDFMKDFHAYNKMMKRVGAKQKSLDEYIQYRQGKSKYTPKKIKDPMKAESFRRQAPNYPSGEGIGVAYTKRAENVYTGGNLMGIATMHKSNMVPVFKQEDAEEIAKMRR